MLPLNKHQQSWIQSLFYHFIMKNNDFILCAKKISFPSDTTRLKVRHFHEGYFFDLERHSTLLIESASFEFHALMME